MTRIPAEFSAKLAGLGPTTRKALDGLAAEEFLARLLYVEHLDKAAAAPGLDADTFRGYSELSRRVLVAAPRAEVEQQIADLRKTASALAHDGELRAGAWGRITELERDNPAVPEEFVTAARTRLAGVAAAERRAAAARRIVPRKAASVSARTKAPASGPTMLYKGLDEGTINAKVTKAVTEATEGLRAQLAKVTSQPIPGGPVLARPTQAIAEGRSTALAKAADFERRAAVLRGIDNAAARGYDELARAERAKAAGK
jgi:hypothetical protein